jgi:hypothetical protein
VNLNLAQPQAESGRRPGPGTALSLSALAGALACRRSDSQALGRPPGPGLAGDWRVRPARPPQRPQLSSARAGESVRRGPPPAGRARCGAAESRRGGLTVTGWHSGPCGLGVSESDPGAATCRHRPPGPAASCTGT